MWNMDPIAEIRARFKKHPNARCQAGTDWIRYEPDSENGFPVELRVGDGEFIVSYDGWHKHFQEVESALDCFAFGLSDMCRLKIVSRGGQPHKWILEFRRNGDWAAESRVGLFVFAFWRPPEIEYRQNALIKAIEADRTPQP